MTAPILNLAENNRKTLQHSSSDIFEWFSRICEICDFRSMGIPAFKHQTTFDVRAKLSEKFEKSLVEHLESSPEDDFSLPTEITKELQEVLSRFCKKSTIKVTDFCELAAWAKLIDEAFFGLGGRFPSDPNERVLKARLRLSETGNLRANKDSEILVAPKGSTGEYGNSINRNFGSISYISSGDLCEITLRTVQDLGLAAITSEENIKVATIAVIQNPTELDWRFDNQNNTYEVYLPERSEEEIVSRTINALEQIGNKAHVVIMPELVSSPGLESAIRDWLQTNRDKGNLLPIAVMAGTSLQTSETVEKPKNIATLLDGDGNIQVSQHKLNQYKLKSAHHSPLSLDQAEPSKDYIENIDTSPSQANICDLPGLGRIAVVICEDLARTQPWRKVLIESGPMLTLTPIMNGGATKDWAWATSSAEAISNESGSIVIIANSGTLFANGEKRCHTGYAAARLPRIEDKVSVWTLIDSGDSDNDDVDDWWLYSVPNAPTNISAQ